MWILQKEFGSIDNCIVSNVSKVMVSYQYYSHSNVFFRIEGTVIFMYYVEKH